MPRPRKTTAKAPAEARRAVLYARASTKEQQDEGYSVEAQVAALREYCERKGLAVAHVFTEADSASRKGRPEFARMLKLVAKEGITDVVVEKTDRAYRNLFDRVKVAEVGVDLHLVKENEIIGPGSRSQSKFMHDIRLVVAKNFSDNLREEVTKGMREKARQGYWPSAAPFGYLNVQEGARKVIAPDPERAPWVRRAFEAYASGGASVKDVTGMLNAAGVHRSRSGRFGPSAVHAVLTNPIYKGLLRWDGEEYPGLHEPLVSRETWDRCQAVLAGRNPNAAGSVAVTKGDFAYKGLIRCSACGCMVSPYVVRKRLKSGEVLAWTYYSCTGAKGCKKVNVREDAITDQLAAAFEKLRIRPSVVDMLRDSLRTGHRARSAEAERIRKDLSERVSNLTSKLEAVYLDKLSGEVPEPIYKGLRVRLEAELAEASAELEASRRAELRSWEQDAAMIDAVSEAADRFRRADNTVRHEMAKTAFSNLLLDGREVRWELKPWFRTVLEANEKDGLNPALEAQLEDWYSGRDSNPRSSP